MSKIPKIIHYCWFGGNPLTPLAEECLASWHEYMPEWEYMRWDEASLTQALSPLKGGEGCWLDYMPLYVKQAYEARKFAFVSDYVRLWALDQYGGVYVDTDVKVLKSYEPLLNDTAFVGFEESKMHMPGTCVMGCEAHCKWVWDMLALYDDIEFIKSDGSLDMTTNVQRMGESLISKGLVPNGKEQYLEGYGLRIYTHDYFSPITSTRVMRRTKNTYSIHYFAESWREKTRGQIIKGWIVEHIIGRKLTDKIVQIKRSIKRGV